MAKLYELAANYEELLNMDDVDAETLKDTLDSINDSIEEKALSIAKMVKELDADATAVATEAKRLADKKKALENRAISLKNYLQSNMEFLKRESIKTGIFTIKLQKNPPAVKINDENAIPDDYFNVIPASKVLDKKTITEALKNDIEVPGAELTQGKRLAIK